MTLSDIQINAIEHVLRDVLAEVSPEEVMLIEGSVTAKSAREFDGMLGFGIGPEFLLVLPVVLEGLKELASTATVEVAKKWGKDLAEWMTGKRSDAFSTRELQRFAELLRGRLEKRGFPSDKAVQITDCVVATLVSRPKLLQDIARK
jgi:hypothetical protein